MTKNKIPKVPVSAHVTRTKRKTVMHQIRIDQITFLRFIQQIIEQAHMTKAPTNPITGTIFIQNEDLPRREPALNSKPKLQTFLHFGVSKNFQSNGKTSKPNGLVPGLRRFGCKWFRLKFKASEPNA